MNWQHVKGYDKLPQIVIAIARPYDGGFSEVEDSVCRLAQMARAAGMHLYNCNPKDLLQTLSQVLSRLISQAVLRCRFSAG